MKGLKIIIPLLLIMSSAALGQVAQTAVPFLLIAPGARAAGMGETFIAVSDDATAVHWNPAGLGKYPLTNDWKEYNLPSSDSISAMVLVKNEMPEVNYKQYDIWGIVNNKLALWNGEKWLTGVYKTINENSSLESMIIRYTGLDDDAAAIFVDKMARENNVITPETLDSLQAVVKSITPEKYNYDEDIDYGFEKLHRAYLRLRINPEGLEQIKADIELAKSQNPVSEETINKITFGFDRAIASKGDREIWLSYNLILPETKTCLGSDDNFLFVGTNNGIFKLNPNTLRWQNITVESDSLPSDNITAIEKVGNRTLMYIGTDNGVTTFTGRRVKAFSDSSNVPGGNISAIAANSRSNAWIVADGILYHYNGIKWSESKTETISIGENIGNTVKKYYGSFGKAWHDEIMLGITEANTEAIDSVEAGQTLNLPFKYGYKGDITDIAAGPEGNLWIGTTYGIVLLDDNGFHHYGYKIFTVPDEGKTVVDVASQYITDRNENKINRLATLIKQFNNLESDELEKDDLLLIYANALGSEISYVIAPDDNKSLVATSAGIIKYDNGNWSRLTYRGLSNTEVVDIYEKNGELWFAGQDKVSIYAKAKTQMTFMHSNYLVQLADDLYYDYLSIVYPTDEWGTFGFGVTFLSYGKQDRTSETGINLGTFFSYDIAATLSYGTRLSNKLSGGVSLRYINSHLAVAGAGTELGKGTGYSIAVDGGLLYQMSKRLTLASTVTNIGPDMAYIDADQADPLPRKLAVGFNYKLVDSPFNKVLILGELNKLLVDLNDDMETEIEEIIPHLGIEYWYSNYVGLRTGYVYDDKGKQKYITLGASLQYTNYRFDFSYIPTTNDDYNRLGNTMRFSMNAGF